MAIKSIVGGESIQGTALWLEMEDGYVWSGGCSAVSLTAPATTRLESRSFMGQLVPLSDLVDTASQLALTIPLAAKALLDLIAEKEAPAGYGTLYNNKQSKLPTPLTQMTLSEVITAGPGWNAQYGSSACGRYQFMNATLKSLKLSEGLDGSEPFSSALQDRLGYALLDQRGYEGFVIGRVSRTAFGLALAEEWASFPVLEVCKGAHREVQRGETFYAGDGLNKALISPEQVEAALDSARKAAASGD